MKKIIYTLFSLLLSTAVLADVPQSFKYQAVLRDAAGQVLENQQVSIEIVILQGSTEGEPVIVEVHNTNTNVHGLVNLEIGSETSLEEVDWQNGPFFIKVSVNDNEMGTSQLLSVPFALYALNSGDGFSGDYEDLTNTPNLEGMVQIIADPEIGDLAYFDGAEWKSLARGFDGDFLQMVDGLPQWRPLDGIRDLDGNMYGIVQIGEKEWLDRNLATAHYQNGDPIPFIANPNTVTSTYHDEWINTTEGAWSNIPHEILEGIDSVEEAVEAYGKYYNFHAIEDPRGICPVGFRVATADEWIGLRDQAVADGLYIEFASGRAFKSARTAIGPGGEQVGIPTNEHPRWNYNASFYGTDDYGFGWLPAVFRESTDGRTHAGSLGFIGRYWTSSTNEDGSLGIGGQILGHLGMFFPQDEVSKNIGAPVRCVRE